MEDQRVVRLRALDEPVHRVEDVHARRARARVGRVVREHHDVVPPVPASAQEAAHVARVVHAPEQLVRLALVVDADLSPPGGKARERERVGTDPRGVIVRHLRRAPSSGRCTWSTGSRGSVPALRAGDAGWDPGWDGEALKTEKSGSFSNYIPKLSCDSCYALETLGGVLL